MRDYCIYLQSIIYRNRAATYEKPNANQSVNMKGTTKKIASSLSACLMGVCLSNTSIAANYYQWVDEAGITHYGSTPPAGITANKIKSSGSKSAPPQQTTANPTNTNDALATQKAEERKKELLIERQAQCAQEKERLQTLTAKGRRIRMEDENGNARYLNAEELTKEISISEQFLQEACN